MTVVAEERASFDPAKKQAAQAWADFADLRDELAKLDGDPSPAEVDELDTLHATYEEKAKTVEREEEAWLHSLDAKDNGTKARKRGPVAKAIMDEISEKALVSPSGAVLSPRTSCRPSSPRRSAAPRSSPCWHRCRQLATRFAISPRPRRR